MALEYSIDVNGVLLEGVPANMESCYLLQKVSGLDDTPITDDVDGRPVGDGDIFGAQSARGISLTVEGLIVAQDHADLRAKERALRAACPTRDLPWPVTLTGRAGDPAGGLQAAFRKTGPLQMADDGGSSNPRWIKPFQLAIRSESSWWVDPSPDGYHQADVFPATEGGQAWPVTWPINWGSGIGPGTGITNNADPVWPTLTINGPCVNLAVENVTTGQAIVFNTILAAGESLVINTRDRTLIDAYGAGRYGDVNRAATSWWRLEPGVNEIRFHPAAASGSAKLIVAWRDTYQ